MSQSDHSVTWCYSIWSIESGIWKIIGKYIKGLDLSLLYVHAIETYCFNAGRFTNPAYYDLLCTIHNKIEEGQFGVAASPEKRNILRTAVHSVGSPLWTEETHVSSYQQKSDLALFFYCLRSLIRSAYAVCVLTLPSHLFQVRRSINFHITAC